MGIFSKPRLRNLDRREDLPEGLWNKCPDCGTMIHNLELGQNLDVCLPCGHHFQIASRERIGMLADPGSFEETDVGLVSVNPLGFHGYAEKTAILREKTGLDDAVVAGRLTIGGHRAMIAVMDFKFFAGSMGSVVGEKITRAVELAIAEKRGVIIISASSGARMQEGMFSLMQMAKTSAAIAKMRSHGLPFISVLTHPTTGGVSASLGMLGDLNIAEPKALIGFAGPRVIEQTVRETLPEGFQRSEFLVEHGAIDLIIDRRQMRDRLADLLALMMQQPKHIRESV
jgi:acetyl-CoA carboxylase carboxyl transferase subunit beta